MWGCWGTEKIKDNAFKQKIKVGVGTGSVNGINMQESGLCSKSSAGSKGQEGRVSTAPIELSNQVLGC